MKTAIRLSALLATLCLAAPASRAAGDCAADTLGTARTLTLKREAAAYGKQYAPLALARGEVVLTFDDGPRPETLGKVMAALESQCTFATFFMTGQNLREFPGSARQVEAAGHTTALHSFAHPQLPQMAPTAQLADLDEGIRAYIAALGHEPAAYRFPFLADTPVVLAALRTRRMTAMSVDVGIDDWHPNDMRSEQLVRRLLQRLGESGGGIILLHDANGPTAEALPALLAALRDNHYKVVHLRWE